MEMIKEEDKEKYYFFPYVLFWTGVFVIVYNQASAKEKARAEISRELS